jgi:hypothetical protein
MARTRDEITQDATEGARSTDKRKRPRITVFLTAEGKPDFYDLPSDQRAALIEALPKPEEPAEPAAPIEPAAVALLVNLIVGVESAIVARQVELSSDQVREALQPNPIFADSLNVAGAKVLNKYSGVLGRWQDEIMLATLVVSWQLSAFAEIRRIKSDSLRSDRADSLVAAMPPKPEPVSFPKPKRGTRAAEIDSETVLVEN